MKIRIVRGRDLTDDDRAGALPAALVNEAFVKRFLPSVEALGHRVDVGRGWATKDEAFERCAGGACAPPRVP